MYEKYFHAILIRYVIRYQNKGFTSTEIITQFSGHRKLYCVFNTQQKWVLVFPPFNNYRRCLIHQIVENNYGDLKSFSIGEEDERRTVVCFNKDFSCKSQTDVPSVKFDINVSDESPGDQVFKDSSSDSGLTNRKKAKRQRKMPSVSIYRPPAARKLEQNANLSNLPPRDVIGGSSPEKTKIKCSEEPRKTESNGISMFRSAITSIRTQNKVPKCKNIESTNRKSDTETKIKTEDIVKSTVQSKQRRPDMQVYVPKGRRAASFPNNEIKPAVSVVHEEKLLKTPEPVVPEKEVVIVKAPNSKNKSTVSDTIIEVENSESKSAVQVIEPEVTNNDTQKECESFLDPVPPNSSHLIEGLDSEKVFTNCSTSCAQPSESENSVKKENVGPLNPDECDWESMFDDTGECLDPSLLNQLTSTLGEVTIEKPKSNYNVYKTKTLDMVADEFPHVIEIYNFPPEFQLHDLMTVFSQFKNSGFEIKWVDDTHALGIFSSQAVVSEVLSFYHPFVKTRSLREGTPLSKMKARRSAEFLLPYKPRPDTCPALARRLVTGALGVKLPTSREEREAEKKILTKAREKKRLEAKQKEDAWEGTFS